MKVFISHSWKNKTQAQQIADELKAAGLEIWVDASNLLPGQQIQKSIDKVLKDIDVIILVWTKEASKSDGVASEIFTCSSLNKLIIPCKIDKTPLDIHPYLSQIKGISFHDFNDGIGRLKMVLLNYMAQDFDIQNSESFKLMNEFMGTLETASHLVNKEDIKNKGSKKDKDYWIKKIESTHDASFDKLKAEETSGKEMMSFLNEKMSQLQTGLNNKKIVGEILEEMKAHKYAGRPDMKKFITQVHAIYKSFENSDTVDLLSGFRNEIEKKLKSSRDQLKSSLGLLGEMLFAEAFENTRYFFLSSVDNLQRLLQLKNHQSIHPSVTDCAEELLKYTKAPGGVIDNTQYGILGYSDDAYFIHNIVSALQQEGLINTADWNIDWIKINAGAEFVFNLVGNHIKNMLDQNIEAYFRQLVQKYNPQLAEQQQPDKLQTAKDDLWKAKLMSLETSMIHHPVY